MAVKNYKLNGVTYSWAGKAVTGTSTSSKVFRSSGVPSAAKNNTYLNVSTGNVYQCTKKGKPSKAQWKYVKTVVVKKPTIGVRALKLVRGDKNRIMTASWKLPSAFDDKNRGARAEHIVVRWELNTSAKGAVNIIDKETRAVVSTQASENLENMKIDSGKAAGRVYKRSDFYPYKGKPKLYSITARVTPSNSRGVPGPSAKEADKKTPVSQALTYKFEKPTKPTIKDWAFDTDTGIVSAKITVSAGAGKRERAWTWWKVTVTDTSRAKGKQTWVSSSNPEDTRAEIPISYNVGNYQELTSTQYVRVHVAACAMGFAGDSETTTGDYYVCFPKSPKIDAIDVSSKNSSGKCTVRLTVKSSKPFLVDRVKLQKLVDVEYAKVSDIPGNAGWEDAGAIDDAKCTALVCGVADVMPSAGNHTWLRVKAWHANENALFAYSNVVEIKKLFSSAPSAEDNACSIVAATATEDGGADVVVAWDKTSSSGDDDTTSMELAWSQDADAWRSVTGPQSYEFDWRDSKKDPRASGWNRTATVKVTGLNDGSLYHFRARCITDNDGNITKGAWCNPRNLLVSSEQPSAVLSADSVSPSGSGVSFAWAFSSTSPQKTWALVATVDGREVVVMDGRGTATGCVVPWARVSANMADNALTCRVRCSSGGEAVESAPVTVHIAEPPTIAVSASTLTAQPLAFGVTSDMPLSQLVYTVRDAAGNVVDTGAVSPVLAESGGSYSGTVTLTGNRAFEDTRTYTVSAVAASSYGLQSEVAEAAFAVDWAHKAPAPPEELEIEPEVLEPDDGPVTRRCTVRLSAPEGAAETDVYDVYRITHDGIDLVSPEKGFPLDYTFVDDYAPFGDAGDYGYRVVTKTADGDAEFRDYQYYLEGGVLRFDFTGGSVELPYNIGISDAYEKDAETRMHLDGSTEAYFNPGVTRKATLSSDIIRIDGAEDAAAVRALGRHPGTAFVRTPDGSAYEAHVDVSSMDVDYGVIAASFDAHEVATSAAFKLPLPKESESEEEDASPDTPVEPIPGGDDD